MAAVAGFVREWKYDERTKNQESESRGLATPSSAPPLRQGHLGESTPPGECPTVNGSLLKLALSVSEARQQHNRAGANNQSGIRGKN